MWFDIEKTQRGTRPHAATGSARPESGRIAVKAINHYGDEILKVFEVVQ